MVNVINLLYFNPFLQVKYLLLAGCLTPFRYTVIGLLIVLQTLPSQLSQDVLFHASAYYHMHPTAYHPTAYHPTAYHSTAYHPKVYHPIASVCSTGNVMINSNTCSIITRSYPLLSVVVMIFTLIYLMRIFQVAHAHIDTDDSEKLHLVSSAI